MSLFSANGVAEDGTGLANATSYISAAEAKKYLNNVAESDDLGNLEEEALLKYLNRATLFLETEFKFSGDPKKESQALHFPLSDQNSVPDNVKIATIEVARLLKSDKLFFSPGDKDTFVTERTVGPITTKYQSAVEVKQQTKQKNNLSFIEDLLNEFLEKSADGPVEFCRG